MEAQCYTQGGRDLGLREPFGMNVPTSALRKDASPECSFLTSVDLQSLLQQRTSFDNLDVCQLASSPDSLFSPRGSLSLPGPGEHNLFAELFPGSLLFPSPTSLPSPATDELAPAPVPAPLPARLPAKVFEHMPPATLDANAASTLPAARNLLQRLDSCVSQDAEAQPEQRPSPKRRRTSAYRGCSSYVLLGEDAEGEDAEMADAMGGCASDHDVSGGSQPGGSCGFGYGYGYDSASQQELGGSHSLGMASDDEEDGEDAKLESKRARNREAARRMRQRQRQQISKLEVEAGNQYDTIQGLLGKLSMLAKEMKCTAKENDLLKQLLNTAATQATTGTGCEALPTSAALMPLGLLAPGLDSGASGSQGLLSFSSAFPTLLPAHQEQEAPLLMPAKGSGAHAAVQAACGGTHACPPASCPASPLPPSPFASPKRPLAPRSPSKPLTPQRLALRSPFAAAPQERGPSRLSMLIGPAAVGAALPAAAAPAPVCAGSKALLLEQLASEAAPLQQAVAQALRRRLQQQQEAELCGRGPAWSPQEQVTDEEAAQIAAMALQHSLGNVSAAVLQLLSWGGVSEERKAVA